MVTSKYHAKKVIEAMRGWHLVLEVEHYSLDPQKIGIAKVPGKNFLNRLYSLLLF